MAFAIARKIFANFFFILLRLSVAFRMGVALVGYALLAGMVLSLSGTSTAALCNNPVVRREWNQLSTAEKNQCEDYNSESQYSCFFSGSLDVAAAKASASYLTGSVEPGKMSWYDLVADHVRGAGVAHGNAQFYPFHRVMIFLWEATLVSNGWDGGAVYWDWSAVSQNWWQADVFTHFGSTSRPGDNCLTDGQFAIGEYFVSPNPAFGSFARNYTGGDEGCLRRCGPHDPLDSPEAIAEAHLKASSYNEFRGNDGVGYHANGHLTIGGGCDMGN
jgi:hypothetical protein